MIIKAMKTDKEELIVTKNEDGSYNAMKITNNKQSEFHKVDTQEDALAILNDWAKIQPLCEFE